MQGNRYCWFHIDRQVLSGLSVSIFMWEQLWPGSDPWESQVTRRDPFDATFLTSSQADLYNTELEAPGSDLKRLCLSEIGARNETTILQRGSTPFLFYNNVAMVDELNVGIENGNWSNKDIVIAYVHLLKTFSKLSEKYIFCSRLVGPTASGKSSVGFSSSFHHSTVILTPGSQVRWTGSRDWRPI